jgi:hypothetical protein
MLIRAKKITSPLFYVKLFNFFSNFGKTHILMIMKASKWNFFINSSRFVYKPNNLWTCFWPSKIHNLDNFFEHEMFTTFLGKARLHLDEILMGYVCFKIFMDNLFYKINNVSNKNYAIYIKYIMYHLRS